MNRHRTLRAPLRAMSLLLALLVCIPALAAPPTPPAPVDGAWSLDELMHSLRLRQSGEAAFTETKYLSTLKVPLVVEGRLRYHAPDTLEKEILKPSPERYVIAGDAVEIHRNGRLRHRVSLAEHPALQGFAGSLIATMAGDLPALQRQFDVQFEGPREQWSLRLRPREPALARSIDRIEVRGHAAEVGYFEIRQRNGDRSVMQITPQAPGA